jgi:hypothetical protein
MTSFVQSIHLSKLYTKSVSSGPLPVGGLEPPFPRNSIAGNKRNSISYSDDVNFKIKRNPRCFHVYNIGSIHRISSPAWIQRCWFQWAQQNQMMVIRILRAPKKSPEICPLLWTYSGDIYLGDNTLHYNTNTNSSHNYYWHPLSRFMDLGVHSASSRNEYQECP